MATRSLNKVILIGNLTRDPELRYTPAGTAVCTFGLATNRTWTTQSGEVKEETEFHRIVAWNKLGELCGQLLAKGRKVYVEGRLATHSWIGQDGAQRTTTETIIEDMIILDSKRPVREEEVLPEAVTPSPPAAVPVVTVPPSDDSGKPKKGAKKSTTKGEESKEEGTKEKGEEKNEDITPSDIPF